MEMDTRPEMREEVYNSSLQDFTWLLSHYGKFKYIRQRHMNIGKAIISYIVMDYYDQH
jgi:hypothetical protein